MRETQQFVAGIVVMMWGLAFAAPDMPGVEAMWATIADEVAKLVTRRYSELSAGGTS